MQQQQAAAAKENAVGNQARPAPAPTSKLALPQRPKQAVPAARGPPAAVVKPHSLQRAIIISDSDDDFK